MRNLALFGTAALAFALGASAAHAQSMTLTSTEISEGATIPTEQVECKGPSISPSLKWSGAPSGTKSFAITMYDPDAPTGSGFWHWVVFDIPPTVTSLPKNAGNVKKRLMPKGAIQARNDTGGFGYSGPCPPPGDPPHHYTITVFAVDLAKLPKLDRHATPAFIGFNLHFHTLAKATLMGTYGLPAEKK